MSKLGNALRARFKTPAAALEALNLDPALLAMDAQPKYRHGGSYREKPAITGDSKENHMATTKLSPGAAAIKGALHAFLRPRLAADSAMIDLNPIVRNLTAANFDKARLTTVIRQATAGNLAADADLEDLPELLENIESMAGEASEAIQGGGEMETPVGEENPDEAALMEEPDETAGHDLDELVAMIQALSPEDRAKLDEMITHKVEPEVAAIDEEKDKEEDPKMKPVTQEAMDAAIANATRTARANERAIHEAQRIARPWSGDFTIAFDSAEDVYAAALKGLGISTKGVHPSAFRTILELQPLGGPKPNRIALDAAGAKSFAEMFPGASRIGQMG